MFLLKMDFSVLEKEIEESVYLISDEEENSQNSEIVNKFGCLPCTNSPRKNYPKSGQNVCNICFNSSSFGASASNSCCGSVATTIMKKTAKKL